MAWWYRSWVENPACWVDLPLEPISFDLKSLSSFLAIQFSCLFCASSKEDAIPTQATLCFITKSTAPVRPMVVQDMALSFCFMPYRDAQDFVFYSNTRSPLLAIS